LMVYLSDGYIIADFDFVIQSKRIILDLIFE